MKRRCDLGSSGPSGGLLWTRFWNSWFQSRREKWTLQLISAAENRYNTITLFRTKLNSVALVRERTIPTDRPPPVGEVSANFCGQRGVTWSAQWVPTAVNLCFLDLEPLLIYSSSSSVDLTRLTRLTRLSRPRSRPTTTQKNLVAPGIETETSVSVARNSDH